MRSDEVKKMVEAFKEKNGIGKIKPSSMKKARSIAAAIAYKKACRGKK